MTLDTDHNWHPTNLEVRLGQQEHVDERGHLRHPIYVDCGGHTLSPTQARTLAATLLTLADAAEQLGGNNPYSEDTPHQSASWAPCGRTISGCLARLVTRV